MWNTILHEVTVCQRSEAPFGVKITNNGPNVVVVKQQGTGGSGTSSNDVVPGSSFLARADTITIGSKFADKPSFGTLEVL